MAKLSFEKSMERLNEIVTSLEKGNSTLDESLKLFEEGTTLIKTCNEMLNKAEQKVNELKIGEDGKPEEIPFED